MFGTPRDAADLYYQRMRTDIVDGGGSAPPVPPVRPADEYTEQEMRNWLTYMVLAYHNAEEEGETLDLLDQIEEDYIEMMCALAVASDKYAHFASAPWSSHLTPSNPEKQKLHRSLVVATLVEEGLPHHFDHTVHEAKMLPRAESTKIVDLNAGTN